MSRPARSRAEAFRAFRDRLQQVVSCITYSVLTAHGDSAGQPNQLLLTPPASLSGSVPLVVGLGQYFDIVTQQTGRTWTVTTTQYVYDVADEHGVILGYHYHPEVSTEVPFPHVHVYRGGSIGDQAVGTMHLPTGPISLASFIRLLHREFDVPYIRPDAETILDRAEQTVPVLAI